jgi:RNA polymerase sigma-70 factor (ECF subfamily)
MARTPGEDEIRRIYRETIDDLYAFVSRRCDGDRDLAEDVTQETWLRAVKAWRADGVPERPVAWLATVAGRIVSNHFRRPAAMRLDDGSGDTVAAPDPRASHEAAETRSLVERAMSRLPALQVRLLEAFHYERRSVGEIAATFGLSERGVEGRLRRARQKLRHEIRSDHDAEGGTT